MNETKNFKKHEIDQLGLLRKTIRKGNLIIIHRGSYGQKGGNKWSIGYIYKNNVYIVCSSLLKYFGFNLDENNYINVSFMDISQSFSLYYTIINKLNISNLIQNYKVI